MLLVDVHIMLMNIVLIVSLYRGTQCNRELRLLGLMTDTGIIHQSAGSCLPAIDMALTDIRRQSQVLRDYNLTFNWADSKCHAGSALFQMFKHLDEDPPYHMLLGPSCSRAGEATAQVSYMWNLTQLACETSSPILSDRTRFPRFFRITVPDQVLDIARLALLDEFNWKRVATVHQSKEFFAAITEDFVKRIQHTNISIISQEIIANDPFGQVANLKRHDARIILTAMYMDKARQLMCAAYKAGWYGPKIVWMFIGWYGPTFWVTEIPDTECTVEQLALVVEGAFLIGSVYQNPIEERGIANITASEFIHRYINHPSYNPKLKHLDTSIPFVCYDYIWTSALALHCSAQVLKDMGHPKPLEQFTYADDDIGDVIFNCMTNVSMVGVSGKISFKQGSDTEEKITEITRIQGGKRKKLSIYRQDKNPSYFEWIDGALKWKNDLDFNIESKQSNSVAVASPSPLSGDTAKISLESRKGETTTFKALCTTSSGLDPKTYKGENKNTENEMRRQKYYTDGIIPKDSSQIKNEEIKLPLALYASMITLAAFGVGLSLSFLGFNVIYRKNRNVKMSSPNINNLLLIGCVLCYLTVLFQTFGHENTDICRAKTYCFSLGFTLTFGSLFSKTWRVYRIFINKKMNIVHIKDSQLFIVIGLLVALVLILLVISDVVGPQKIQYKFLSKEVYETTDGTEIRPFVRHCWSKYSSYFNWSLYIIQGALLTFGTFLAWETRNVKVKELNDSQKIGMSLYNVVTLSVIGLLLTLLLEDQETLLYGLSSGFVIVGTTVTQMLIFIPKVRGVVSKLDVEHISSLAPNTTQQSRPSPSGESRNVETISSGKQI